MKDKFKGLIFLAFCFIYIARRIIVARKWNMFIVDLEEKDGRRQLRYQLSGGKYVLEIHDRKSVWKGDN